MQRENSTSHIVVTQEGRGSQKNFRSHHISSGCIVTRKLFRVSRCKDHQRWTQTHLPGKQNMKNALPLTLKLSVYLCQEIKCWVVTPRSDWLGASRNIQQGKKHLQNAKQQSSSSTPFPEVSVQQACSFTEKKKGEGRTEEPACPHLPTPSIKTYPVKKAKKPLQNTRNMRPSSGTLQIHFTSPTPIL